MSKLTVSVWMLRRHSAGDCGAPVQKESSVAAGPNTCHGLTGQSALQERQALQKTPFTTRFKTPQFLELFKGTVHPQMKTVSIYSLLCCSKPVWWVFPLWNIQEHILKFCFYLYIYFFSILYNESQQAPMLSESQHSPKYLWKPSKICFEGEKNSFSFGTTWRNHFAEENFSYYETTIHLDGCLWTVCCMLIVLCSLALILKELHGVNT